MLDWQYIQQVVAQQQAGALLSTRIYVRVAGQGAVWCSATLLLPHTCLWEQAHSKGPTAHRTYHMASNCSISLANPLVQLLFLVHLRFSPTPYHPSPLSFAAGTSGFRFDCVETIWSVEQKASQHHGSPAGSGKLTLTEWQSGSKVIFWGVGGGGV